MFASRGCVYSVKSVCWISASIGGDLGRDLQGLSSLKIIKSFLKSPPPIDKIYLNIIERSMIIRAWMRMRFRNFLIIGRKYCRVSYKLVLCERELKSKSFWCNILQLLALFLNFVTIFSALLIYNKVVTYFQLFSLIITYLILFGQFYKIVM